jgi:hypothetical protein
MRHITTIQEELQELHKSISYPWLARAGYDGGENWGIASFGNSGIDNQDWYVTTDRVRASEYEGDAKTDAEGMVRLRNLLPRIVELLDDSAAKCASCIMATHEKGATP